MVSFGSGEGKERFVRKRSILYNVVYEFYVVCELEYRRWFLAVILKRGLIEKFITEIKENSLKNRTQQMF